MGLWGLSLSSQKDHDLSPLPHECSYHLLSFLDLACVSSKKMLSLHQKMAADEILAVGMIKKKSSEKIANLEAASMFI